MFLCDFKDEVRKYAWGSKEEKKSMEERIEGLSEDGQALVGMLMDKIYEEDQDAKSLEKERDRLKKELAFYEEQIKTKGVKIPPPMQ